MDIEKQLEEAKRVFLTDVDEEDAKENLERLQSWEKELRDNASYAQWQANDVTRSIAKQAREAYQDASMQLALNRELDDEQRMSLWAKQDACAFILSLTDKDAKTTLAQLQTQIRNALRAVQ